MLAELKMSSIAISTLMAFFRVSKPIDAEREERRGDDQIVLERNHRSVLRRTSIAAPRSATSSSTEAISKGST